MISFTFKWGYESHLALRDANINSNKEYQYAGYNLGEIWLRVSEFICYLRNSI
jgi:hypothetical protein